MIYKDILIILIVFPSLVTCRDLEWKNTTNELSFQPSIFNGIHNGIWNEMMDPIPLIVAIITYTTLKFTGVLGFLRLLYTLINQSST